MATSYRNTVPDRTKEAENKKKRKESKSDSGPEWPNDVEILRIALKEMNEEEEKIALDTPPDTPMSEIHTRKRAWHRRITLYLDMIAEALSKHHRKANPAKRENESVLGLAGKADVELVLQLYIKEKRSSTEQSAFRDNLMDFYGVSRNRDGIKECWCVVSHSWGASKQRIAAHIMPVRLRQLPTGPIFGEEATEELFSVKNGLMLESQIEKYFDSCQLAIVPCLSDEDAWELRVMDKHLLNEPHFYTVTA
ncbi:hypothetical protein EAF04_004092 [Stromatinia cepivora]|nr:hypothetical protein EAF04_004092 [Stromatinia cepivora]